MKYLFFILIAACNTQAEVKPLMQEFYSLTDKLQPYIIDKKSFMDSKNEKEIAKALSEFNQNTKKLKKDKMTQTDDMKFRAKLLTEGLDEADTAFKDGFKDYSYWALKSTLNNCYSCHTQKGLTPTAYKFSETNTHDSYSKAEFLFIVRNYAESIPLFENLLTGYPVNKSSVENIESSAQKLLFYSIRVSRDDIKTIEMFNRILKNKELPSGLRSDFLAWRRYLNIRKYRVSDDLSITDEKSLTAFMNNREKISEEYKYNNQRAAADMDTTHFLFQLMEKSDSKKIKPSILYWLASIERYYRISMFDQTADNYLKECIEKYSSHKIAKKCLTLYKEIQTLSYTGSRGTDLPKSVIKQFELYESMVNKK
ncbi:hypothetical protein K2P97_13000 [bacterium]|nr:hypothetical protein [bacterium]